MSDAPLTEEDFFGFWKNQEPQVEKPIEYRLYHDENGFPLFFSSEDVPGNYIVVDQDTFLRSSSNIRVVDGKLKVYYTAFGKKLVPSDIGTACDPSDICVVVADDQPHTKWTLKHQEIENDKTN